MGTMDQPTVETGGSDTKLDLVKRDGPPLEPRTIRAEPGRRQIFLALGLGLAVAIGFSLADEPDRGVVLYVAGFFAALLALGNLAAILFDRPRMTLDEEGITQKSLFGTHHWAWKEIGRFRLTTTRAVYNPLVRIYWVCAYTDDHYDLLLHHQDTKPLEKHLADVCFSLTLMKPGHSLKNAEAFVAELNTWRNVYGEPDVEVVKETAGDELKGLRRRLLGRELRHWGWMSGLLVLSIAFSLL